MSDITGIVSRLPRLVLSDRFFFITCRLFHGRRKLSKQEIDCLAHVIHSCRKRHGFLLTAWVFLPDHWHDILYPHSPLTISNAMESIKVSSTRRINRGRGELGQLWQGRFFDRALRTVKEHHETLEYIHWNPVKAGLVAQPEDWPSSSAHDYSLNVTQPKTTNDVLAIDRINLPMDPSSKI
jgi:putative transposase